jgi:hypothetical protein
MTQPTPPEPKPKLKGEPLDLDDAAIDQAAQVTPLDVATAQALWRHSAPPKLTDLLDAKPD